MSALAYNEPYKFSAGLLTLMVHSAFLALLYLGVNWRAQQPEGMEVTLWESLPEAANLPAQSAQPSDVKPAPPQKVESTKPNEAEKPAPLAKADIELAKEKKKPEAKPRKIVKTEPKKRLSKDIQDLSKQEELADRQDQEKLEAQAAAGAAAISSEVGKYIGLIRQRIRSNIVMPPDVSDDAVAEVVVTLLPDGGVLDAKLRKSSGNAAYDDVVERAIKKAEPLPLPQDEAARKQFINPKQLKFKFSPKDKE